jgi:phenylacetyl-CoA:acceptor oxidoreductase 27-kDa subunit
MTRYAMTVDLRRCVGCQTCTAACKSANATPPGVQWRRVLDTESGEFPDVRRSFVPVACMHCDEPPCEEVCPTTATKKRADGLVSIDYDLCIGCANCIMACPYDARAIVHEPRFAYGDKPIASEAKRFDPARLSVATKCTFCIDRIDAAAVTGQVPGRDPEVTPACVNSCISGALRFGDLDDPESNVSRLLAETKHFRMHEELGTGPGVHYIWDREHE